MDRKPLPPQFKPQFDEPIKGMCINVIRRNLFRLNGTIEFDDVLQEAYLLYLDVIKRYRFNSPEHFMIFFQRCMYNFFNKRQAKLNRQPEGHLVDMTKEEGAADDYTSMANPLASFKDKFLDGTPFDLLLEDAPEEVRQLVARIQTSDHLPKYGKRRGYRESTNDYLCKLIGKPTGFPILRMFTDWYKGVNQTI